MIVLAEWTKFRTVRSSLWLLISCAAITVALGLSLLAGILEKNGPRDLDAARAGIWLHGLDLGQLMLAVLGALIITTEYGTGSIRVTLAAVPRRGRVLTAKITGLAGLSLAVGAVSALAMFLLAQPMLHGHGFDIRLSDGLAWRGVALAAAATAGVALLGLGIGLLVRHSAGAVTILLSIMLGVPIIEQFLPEGMRPITRYLPSEAAWAMFTPSEHWLDPGPGTVVFAGWVAAVLIAGAVAFVRRDV